jgi:adenosylcobinamide-phosphate synthase
MVVGAVGDRIFGDPVRFHPVAAFGRAAARLERLLWRPRRWPGAVYTLVLVGGTATTARMIDARLRHRPLARAAFVTIVSWAALGGRSLGREALNIADSVERGEIGEARRRIPSLVGRDPSELGAAELCRAAVESVAENTADAVVGPLLWSAIAGPAGTVAYRAANTLDAMVGHRDERYERFGWMPARLDDLLTWPAARAAAVLAVVLAPLVGGRPSCAWRTLCRDGAAHPSPNAGRLEAAFAGALGIRLGGRNQYGDRVEDRPLLGDGPLPDATVLRRAVRLSEWVGAAAAALCALAVWRLGR